MVLTALLLALLLAAFYFDIRSGKIPNALTISAFAAAIAAQWAVAGLPGLREALTGAGAGFAMMWALYAVRAVGAGDVKLFAALGALCGAATTAAIWMYSILLAGLIAVIVFGTRRELLLRLKAAFKRLAGRSIRRIGLSEGRREPQQAKQLQALKMPFMYAVLPAALLVLWTTTQQGG